MSKWLQHVVIVDPKACRNFGKPYVERDALIWATAGLRVAHHVYSTLSPEEITSVVVPQWGTLNTNGKVFSLARRIYAGFNAQFEQATPLAVELRTTAFSLACTLIRRT